MASGRPGQAHCDCEYEQVKKTFDESRGCLHDLLRVIWKEVHHKKDLAIHDLEKSVYQSLVREKKPHFPEMQSKPLAEWTAQEIFCGLYTRKVQKYLLHAAPRDDEEYRKRNGYKQQQDNTKKYGILLKAGVVSHQCFKRGVANYFQQAHNQVYDAVQTLRTIGHILQHLVYNNQQGRVGKPSQQLLLPLMHSARAVILGHMLWLKKQTKKNLIVRDWNESSDDPAKDWNNTTEHKISNWIAKQMALRNKVPKYTHITHMDASTGVQAIVFRGDFKYVNVVQQNADSAAELFQTIQKGTPGKMPVNFNTYSSNYRNHLCNFSQGVVFSDGMAKKKRNSKKKTGGTQSNLVDGFRTIIKSMCKTTQNGKKPGNKPVLLVLKILDADGLSTVTDDDPEHTTRFESYALSSKMVDDAGHDFFLASVWTVPAAALPGSNAYKEKHPPDDYFKKLPTAIGPPPPQTGHSYANTDTGNDKTKHHEATQSNVHEEPYDDYFKKHPGISLAVLRQNRQKKIDALKHPKYGDSSKPHPGFFTAVLRQNKKNRNDAQKDSRFDVRDPENGSASPSPQDSSSPQYRRTTPPYKLSPSPGYIPSTPIRSRSPQHSPAFPRRSRSPPNRRSGSPSNSRSRSPENSRSRSSGDPVRDHQNGIAQASTENRGLLAIAEHTSTEVASQQARSQMEAIYAMGKGSDQIIVGIKSVFMEIICPPNVLDKMEAVEKCVANVFKDKLTYAVGSWSHEVDKSEPYCLSLYVVWKSKSHSLTALEIRTYVLQLLPRCAEIKSSCEITCSPKNLAESIVYCQGYMPGRLVAHAGRGETALCQIRPNVLVRDEHAVMYVEYGKHPFDEADGNAANPVDNGYQIGPVSKKADQQVHLIDLLVPSAVDIPEAEDESYFFQVTFTEQIAYNVACFETAFEENEIVYVKYALIQSDVPSDPNYMLILAIASDKLNKHQIIKELTKSSVDRTDVRCIMKIGNDAWEKANANFKLVAAHATVAPDSEWTVKGAHSTAAEFAKHDGKRSNAGVFGGEDRSSKLKKVTTYSK